MKNDLLWTIPIEIKTENHAAFWSGNLININLSTNYTNFSGRDSCKDPSEIKEYIALCDLQRGIGACFEHSLGSGRSCFYNKQYFKGIGRTPLVGSWINPHQLLHSNGLLFPSGAFRELIFSLYSSSQGAELINSVHSISLNKGTEYSKKVIENLYADSNYSPGTIEKSMIAQTVKSGNFIRFSNLRWAYSRMGTFFGNDKDFGILKNFISCMKHGLDKKYHDAEVIISDEDLHSLFLRLFQGAVNAVQNVIMLNCSGVKLGSLGNNFSLDGRFLDLEVPVFVGKNQICTHLPASHHGYIEIFECIGILLQFRMSFREFDWWLTQCEQNSTYMKAKNYFKLLIENFHKVQNEFSWIFDDKDTLKYIKDFYLKQQIQLSPKAFVLMQMSLNNPYMQFSIKELGGAKKIDMNFPHYQTGSFPECYSLPQLVESSAPVELERAEVANSFLNKLDSIDNFSEVFQLLDMTSEKLSKQTII